MTAVDERSLTGFEAARCRGIAKAEAAHSLAVADGRVRLAVLEAMPKHKRFHMARTTSGTPYWTSVYPELNALKAMIEDHDRDRCHTAGASDGQ